MDIHIGGEYEFRSPYDQCAEHNGKTGTVIEHITDPEIVDPCITDLYLIRFEDGTELQAWPEELS